jgi:hypothetical protein
MSAVPKTFGPGAKTSGFKYFRVEDQEKVWQEAEGISKLIGERQQ